jgi:uncharacterized protein YfdQ (DUF2303 family)
MDENYAKTIADLAVAGVGIIANDGAIPVVLKPEGFHVESVEQYLLAPLMKRARASLGDLASFIRYVNEHKLDSTRIFASVSTTGAGFHAVIDYHGAGAEGEPAWGKHIATFTCSPTVEWNRWMEKNKRPMSQTEFAAFLEDNQLAIVDPPGADILEMVQTLEAKKDVRFKSTERLSNGRTKLDYDEDIVLSGSTGTNKGQLEVPQTLTLGIAPFVGESPFRVTARLRYRIGEKGALTFVYELVDTHLVIDTVCKEMFARIKAETGIEPFLGSVAVG